MTVQTKPRRKDCDIVILLAASFAPYPEEQFDSAQSFPPFAVDPDQGSQGAALVLFSAFRGELKMTMSEMGMLALIVGAFVFFGATLGWASWMESRQPGKNS